MSKACNDDVKDTLQILRKSCAAMKCTDAVERKGCAVHKKSCIAAARAGLKNPGSRNSVKQLARAAARYELAYQEMHFGIGR